MKHRLTIPLLSIAVCLLTGCILLPVPHEQWLSPRFTGIVTDADTGAPLGDVKITLTGYRYGEEEISPVVTRSDSHGRFTVLASKHANWLPIWLGPAEGTQGGSVLFERDGYAPVEEKRSVFTIASGRTAFELIVHMKKKEPSQIGPLQV